jgi:thymidine phosphorylase
MVRAQGGDLSAPLPIAREIEIVVAPADGYVQRLDAMAVGVAAWRLGAGRARKDDPVSPGAGVRWRAGLGDRVVEGQSLFELHTDDPARLPRALEALEGGWSVGPEPVSPAPLLLGAVADRDR